MRAFLLPERMSNYTDKIPLIIADWRTGEYTVRDLTSKYKVSVGFIAKHTKGVEQDTAQTVNKLVQAKQELANLDEHSVHAVHEVVDERTKHIQFFTNVTVKNIKAMESKLTGELSIVEHKHAQETIAKAKETVLGKEASTQVNIQNNTTINNELVAGAKEQLQQRLAKINGTRLIESQ